MSRQRVYQAGVALAVAAIGTLGISSWLFLTPHGQITQVKWRLEWLLSRASAFTMADAAVAFAKNGQWPKAFEITRKITWKHSLSNEARETRDRSLAHFVSDTAQFLDKTDQRQPALSTLNDQLMPIAEELQDDWAKSEALSAIAITYAELNNPNRIAELLSVALQEVQSIQADVYKTEVLSAIVNAAVRLDDDVRELALLEQVFQVAKREDASSVLKDIAILYALQTQWNKALQTLEHCSEADRIKALTEVLTIWAEKQTPTLSDGAVALKPEVIGN